MACGSPVQPLHNGRDLGSRETRSLFSRHGNTALPTRVHMNIPLDEGMATSHPRQRGTYLEQSQVWTMPGGEEDGRMGAIARHLVALHPIPCLEGKTMDP